MRGEADVTTALLGRFFMPGPSDPRPESDGAGYQRVKLVEIVGLDEATVRASLVGALDGDRRRHAGEDDRNDVLKGRCGLDKADDVAAVSSRQHEIDKGQVIGTVTQSLYRLLAVGDNRQVTGLIQGAQYFTDQAHIAEIIFD